MKTIAVQNWFVMMPERESYQIGEIFFRFPWKFGEPVLGISQPEISQFCIL